MTKGDLWGDLTPTNEQFQTTDDLTNVSDETNSQIDGTEKDETKSNITIGIIVLIVVMIIAGVN